jgi:predicted secreted hydrolase
MDHERFTHQIEENQAGWDWFSAQLDDGTELMLFELRLKDGLIDPHSSGTFIGRDGRQRHLRAADFTLEPRAYSGKYPVLWRIRVPALGIDLECRAALPDQELRGEGVRYWEGAVTYSGSHTGVGYLEMTGYAGPVRL